MEDVLVRSAHACCSDDSDSSSLSSAHGIMPLFSKKKYDDKVTKKYELKEVLGK